MSDESEKSSNVEPRYEVIRESLKLVAEGLKFLDALASLLLRLL